MASSDNFREQLKAGNLSEALTLALTQAVELKITTSVVSVNEERLDLDPAQPGHRLQTHINSLEGAIKTEIGEPFVGNGPYRELLKFHLDQVAQGNLMIQNNLKSLQKLFEVLVALHGQTRLDVPTPYPDILPPETPPLFPTTSLAEPQWADVTETTSEETTPPGVTIDSLESAIAYDFPPELTASDLPEISDTDTAADDRILDLLESLPTPPPLSPQGLEFQESGEEEDWGDWVEEPPVELVPSESDLDEDWGMFQLGDVEPPPLASAPAILEPETDTPKPEEHPTTAPQPEAPHDSIQTDQRETVEQQPEPHVSIPSLDSLDLEAEDDWDEWVVEEPTLGETSGFDQPDEDTWGDLVEDFDPFAATPPLQDIPSNLDMDEDWDNFSVEELEPYSDIRDVGRGLDTTDSSEELPLEAIDQLETDPVQPRLTQASGLSDPLDDLDRVPPILDETDWPEEESFESMDQLFAEDESPTEELDAALGDETNLHTIEEDVFNEISFEEFLVEGFDPLAESEDDWEANPKSGEKDSPSSSRFPPLN